VRWAQQGRNIQIRRGDPEGDGFKRTWEPIANYGTNHWVLESENTYTAGVLTGTRIATRVNNYMDEGPAAPMAADARPKSHPLPERAGAPRAALR
jgi:hypothetical protein